MKAGWEIKKLGEVCDFLNRGISPKYLEQGGISVLNQKCVRDHRISYEQGRRHDSLAKTISPGRLIQIGDVLVNSTGTGTLGRIAQVRDTPPEPTTVDSHVTIVRPKQGKFYLDFFGYMMSTIEDAIKESGEGCGGQTELARSALADKFSVLYPISLTEQQRIVAFLDEAFEGIATAKANAEKNLKNARQLFESHLNSVFSQRDEGWVEKRLGDIAKTQYGLSVSMNENAVGYKCFRMGEVQNGQLIDTGLMKYADVGRGEFEKYKLNAGDVLFNRTNSFELVGKTGIFLLDGEYCFASYLVRVLLNQKIMLPDFLNYFMNSAFFQQSLKKKASKSINQANINATILSNEFVRFPESIQEQKAIVLLFDNLHKETQRLESIYKNKIEAFDALKKSILQRAFADEL